MTRFVVRKNTLPYVHQWAVIDTDTGIIAGEYKTEQLAEKACKSFGQHGVPESAHNTPPGFENAWNAVNKRMRRPGGDPQPKPPKRKRKHSGKRIVELD